MGRAKALRVSLASTATRGKTFRRRATACHHPAVSGQALERRQANVGIALAVGLALAALVVFSPGLFAPFLWDDKTLILSNQQVRSLAAWRMWFTHDFADVVGDGRDAASRLHYYRPLITATYALEFACVGARPFLYHLDNLLAHAVTSVLALFALRRWCGSWAGASVGAAFFALHPTKAESVAWIAGRTDLLCTAFILVSLLGTSLRLRDRSLGQRRLGLALETLGTLLAYGTKEGAVVLPVLVVVEAWAAWGRPALDAAALRRLLRVALPQLAVAVVYLGARARWMPVQPPSGGVALGSHALYVLETYGRYLSLTVAPIELSSQHALLRSVEGRAFHDLRHAALGVFGVAACLGAAFWARRHAPLVTLGLLSFLGLLLPVSNVVLVGISTLVAERFLYLPMLGAAAALAGALALSPRRAPIVAGGALVLALAGRALGRSVDFSDEARFWARERALHPESLEALRSAIREARRERRFLRIDALALEGRDIARSHYPDHGAEVDFTLLHLEALAARTPDRATGDLEVLLSLYGQLLDPRVSLLVFPTGPGTATMSLAGPNALRLRGLRTVLLVARAEVESRLGRDAAANDTIDAALSGCVNCTRALLVGVLVRARSGDYARATELASRLPPDPETMRVTQALRAAERLRAGRTSGSPTPHALGLELAALEAWGRAYALLAPHRASLEATKDLALRFGEVAYKAGEAGIARDLLDRTVERAQIQPTLEAWAAGMGWR